MEGFGLDPDDLLETGAPLLTPGFHRRLEPSSVAPGRERTRHPDHLGVPARNRRVGIVLMFSEAGARSRAVADVMPIVRCEHVDVVATARDIGLASVLLVAQIFRLVPIVSPATSHWTLFLASSSFPTTSHAPTGPATANAACALSPTTSDALDALSRTIEWDRGDLPGVGDTDRKDSAISRHGRQCGREPLVLARRRQTLLELESVLLAQLARAESLLELSYRRRLHRQVHKGSPNPWLLAASSRSPCSNDPPYQYYVTPPPAPVRERRGHRGYTC